MERVQRPALGIITSGGDVVDVVAAEVPTMAGVVDEVDTVACKFEDGRATAAPPDCCIVPWEGREPPAEAFFAAAAFSFSFFLFISSSLAE